MPEFPAALYRLEFVMIHVRLELIESLHLAAGGLLQLRRELHRAAGLLGPGSGEPVPEAWAALLDPPLPNDPDARRRIQRPGPPLALLAPPLEPCRLDAGDQVELSWVLWGRGIQYLGDWIGLLQTLGQSGLAQGEGRFELAVVEAEDASGGRSTIWPTGRSRTLAPPPLGNAGWWLEAGDIPGGGLRLEFATPARLLSQGRPLFRPDFRGLFPFFLRRITAMALAHDDLELIDDPAELLAEAGRVDTAENRLSWRDWRTLAGGEQQQDLGGVVGSLAVGGPGLENIGWVVRLASLMNVGKGAAFGCGSFRVSAC